MNKQLSSQPIGNSRYLLLTASILTFLLIVVGGFVRATVSTTVLQPEIVAILLGAALIALAVLLKATITAFSHRQKPELLARLSFRSPFARLTLWTMAAVFAVLVSGALVAGSSSTLACAGWPLCNGLLFPVDIHQWIQIIHRLMVGLSAILVVMVVWRAWKTQRSQTEILPAASVMGVLYAAQVMVGALNTTQGFPVFLMALHVATDAAVWAAVVVLVVVTGQAGRSPEEEREEAAQKINLGQHSRDLFMMTRPVVVLLLLVTAYGGMVVGKQGIPSLNLTFWTLLGGALAAGGAQAINMFVDRDIDRLMQRTAKRPLPAGRLTPAEGLAWGLALCTISVYIVAGFVNGLAALLVLGGILYYVVVYTLVLKRTSAQNIVIGGGAGALPPMVGWAAAAGSLNLEALMLFVLVFLWTPPHFWALAIVRLKDYARAGVPMLPVVSGEAVTRRQILAYAIVLVIVSMLLPLLGMTGVLYLVSAALLGAWLLFSAWQVWRIEGNKVAWTLYRVSSLYLAFLFAALIADALIRIPIG